MKILVLFSLLYTINVNGQWRTISLEEFSKSILEVEQRVPQGQSYYYKSNYTFYEYLNTKDIAQQFTSTLIYHAKTATLNFWQLDKFIVQTAEVQLICDTAYKAIIINYPNPEYNKRKGMEDFSQLLSSKCTAQSKEEGNFTIYSLEFAPNASLKSVEIWIEKNGMVKKYIVYSGREILDDSGLENKMIQPRMEVVYSDYYFGSQADKKEIVYTSHFFKDLKNKELQTAYEGFEVIDLRENTTN